MLRLLFKNHFLLVLFVYLVENQLKVFPFVLFEWKPPSSTNFIKRFNFASLIPRFDFGIFGILIPMLRIWSVWVPAWRMRILCNAVRMLESLWTPRFLLYTRLKRAKRIWLCFNGNGVEPGRASRLGRSISNIICDNNDLWNKLLLDSYDTWFFVFIDRETGGGPALTVIISKCALWVLWLANL